MCRAVFKYDEKKIYAGDKGTEYDDFIAQLGGMSCIGFCACVYFYLEANS